MGKSTEQTSNLPPDANPSKVDTVSNGLRNAAPAQKALPASYFDYLTGLQAIQLNVAREVIFNVRSEWTDSQSKVLVGLNRRDPVAVFGQNGVPSLNEIPEHGLKIIASALQLGTIIAVSKDAITSFKIPEYHKSEVHSRVEGGKDPVLSSGFEATELEVLLTPPSATDSIDPEGDIINKIKTSKVLSERKGVVALAYLEECSRRRSRVLVFLEDVINSFGDTRM